MDLQFYGANCVTISHKGTRIVVDDNLKELGAKSITKNDDVVLFTFAHSAVESQLVFDSPGEYETADISIMGIEARAHMDEIGQKTATMFKVTAEGINILFCGHIYPELNDDQLENIGMVDVLVLPVGGNGYTLDPIGAQKIVKSVEPKLVVPTHYSQEGLNYPVPQQTLENALQEMGLELSQKVTKLKLKAEDLPETTQLVVIEAS